MSRDAPDPRLVDGLRSDLADAAYTVDDVQQLLGPLAAGALAREQPLPAVSVLSGLGEPAAVLARLFLLARPQTRADLDGALPRCGAEGAARLGLVEAAGSGADDRVRPLLDLRPYAAVDALGEVRWWVASDLGQLAAPGPLRTDHVLGIGGASTTLAQATVRRPVGSVLDLGTGCGVQALHATRHARHVVATDLSARALRVAALTLALNGLSAGAGGDVELRQGDLLEPVRGERFDLVVSNPPFVITPRQRGVPEYGYRDAGLTGDEVVRRLVTSVGDVLAAGGTAQLLANWEVHGDDGWQERVGRWVREAGLDAWVVQRELQDPAEYAETWIRDGGQPSGPDFDVLYRAWLDDFADRGVTGIGFGLVILHRADRGSARPWLRLEEQHGAVRQPLGDHIGRCLQARGWLARTGEEELLASRWVVAGDVTEERHHRPGEPDPAAIVLRQTDGFGRAVQVGTVAAAAVGACDGELPLGAIAAAIGALLDVPDGAVRAELLPVVRDLAGDGFLLPAG